MSIIILL